MPPLAGIRVLDLTQFLSGPFGTQILADLGADVIKLEPPNGDATRWLPPHFRGDESLYFSSVNRNKRSVVADLKVPEGLAIARRLALSCDVVIENFRPKVLDRLGFKAEELRGLKPSLIWCSISGFGQDGPHRDRPAYDMIVQALSGGMSLTGEPGRPAVRSGVPIGDLTAGLYAVIGILAALVRRGGAGQGESIDVSMLDCQVAMLSYQAAYYLHSGIVPGPQGTGHDSIATYRGFACAGGTQLVVTANTQRMWEGLCRSLGFEHLIGDPRFLTDVNRYNNREALWALLEPAFACRPATEWMVALEDQGVPAAVVNTLDEVVKDPQVLHRGIVATIGRGADALRVAGNPIFLRDTPAAADRLPPKLGGDTAEVLQDVLGLSADEIQELARAGAIGTRA